MEGPQRCDEARDALAVRVIGSFSLMWTLVVKEHMLPQPLCQSWCTLSDSHSQLRAVGPAGGPGGGGQGSNIYTYKYIHVYRSRSLQPRTAIQYVCLYKYIHARTNTYMDYDVYVLHDVYPPHTPARLLFGQPHVFLYTCMYLYILHFCSPLQTPGSDQERLAKEQARGRGIGWSYNILQYLSMYSNSTLAQFAHQENSDVG